MAELTLAERLALRINEPDVTSTTPILTECLASATDAYMRCRFGVNEDWPESIETRFVGLVLDMAVDLYNRIGAEGQTAHSENGISRTYDSSWISSSLLRQIPPYCGVPK